jgi:alkylhydroperoxidase/carboxymuconolactone decarboxylase family protein YurZ
MSGPARTGKEVLERNRNLIDELRVPAGYRESFADLIQSSVGKVWERPGLTPAQRSLGVISMMAALVRPDDLRAHVGMGLDNGLTPEEIAEAILQCAVYAGFPAAVRAFEVVDAVFEERGIS